MNWRHENDNHHYFLKYPHAETVKLDFKFCDLNITIISRLLSKL